MLTILQAVILGLLQGLTELFPISSLGHSVIIPSVLGWHVNQDDPYFVTFLVATHLATAIVLFLFFWRDWLAIFQGFFRSVAARRLPEHDPHARLAWLLIVATVPVGLLGLILQKPISHLFASAQIAAGFLIVNGLILFTAERLRKRRAGASNETESDRRIAKLSWRAAGSIGLAQAGALVPGISRSGSSMAGGLLAGLNNADAARFSFLLATPIIGAAAILKLPELLQPAARPVLGATMIGALSAALAAYLSVRFLVQYFQTRNLNIYAAYCVLAGIAFSLVLIARAA